MAAARAREDPAPGTGRRREGAHCTPARSSRCGGRPLAKAQHAHARLRARRARRVDAGRRRDPWQSPSYPGSPREARSARTCKAVLAHFTPLSRNLRHLRPCRGGARGAAGPPRAAGGSVAVSGRSLGPHVVAWVLRRGASTTRARPHTMWPTSRRTQRHLSLGHQQELLDASVKPAEARSSRCWDREPATCRVWAPSVACDQHLTLWRTQRRTFAPPHRGGREHAPAEGAAAPWTGAGERAPRAPPTRPVAASRPPPPARPALPPRQKGWP